MIQPNEITFKQTSMACPQVFEASLLGEEIGHLRLRHGVFTVTYSGAEKPNQLVFFDNPKGDGIFEDEEQVSYLDKAAHALTEYINGKHDGQHYKVLLENFKEKVLNQK